MLFIPVNPNLVWKKKKTVKNNKQAGKAGFPGPGLIMLKIIYLPKVFILPKLKNSKKKDLLLLNQENIKFQLLLVILMIIQDLKDFPILALNMLKSNSKMKRKYFLSFYFLVYFLFSYIKIFK